MILWFYCWHFVLIEFSRPLIDIVQQFSNTKNRMLLWHGSRLTNWTGILSQGNSFSLFWQLSCFHKYQCYKASCIMNLRYMCTIIRFAHSSSRGTCNWLHVWQGGVLCWHVLKKCKLLLSYSYFCRWGAPFMWGCFLSIV